MLVDYWSIKALADSVNVSPAQNAGCPRHPLPWSSGIWRLLVIICCSGLSLSNIYFFRHFPDSSFCFIKPCRNDCQFYLVNHLFINCCAKNYVCISINCIWNKLCSFIYFCIVRSVPPVILNSTPFAPSIDISRSGEDIAILAAAEALFSPTPVRFP